jgi:hypothetical protein
MSEGILTVICRLDGTVLYDDLMPQVPARGERVVIKTYSPVPAVHEVQYVSWELQKIHGSERTRWVATVLVR